MIQPKRPTIREVARRAGVSIGTVSNVLTGRKPVREATRLAIETAIRELDYTPDIAARSLIARRGRARTQYGPEIPRLTTVGYLCADYVALVGVLPHRDDRIRARSIEKTLGGCAANVAVTAAGLGPPFPIAAELLSQVGDDPDSDWAIAVLTSRRVDLQPLSRRTGGRLSRCFILVEAQGSRTIINEPLQVPPGEFARWLDMMEQPAGIHCVHLQGDQVPALAPLLPRAREQGLRLVFQSPGLVPAWRTPERLAELRALFDLVVLNREVARDITGCQGSTSELVRRMHELVNAGPGAVTVLTLASEGAALLVPGEEPFHAAAPPVEPVDTTGAGDTFTGTLLAVWLNQHDLREAVRLAVLAGSRSIMVAGAQEHHLTAAELALLTAA